MYIVAHYNGDLELTETPYCCADAEGFDEFVAAYHCNDMIQLEFENIQQVKAGVNVLTSMDYWQGSKVTQGELESVYKLLSDGLENGLFKGLGDD